MWSLANLLRRIPKSTEPGGAAEFRVDPAFITTSMPKVLWIELTSKCPFDCIFCTRKTRFGAGQHLDFEIYKSVIRELESPDFLGLNYSGESIYYPQLLEAIALAKATGAATELVTAFSSISKKLLAELVASGLDRLAVSLHTMDPEQYKHIYQFSTLELLKERIGDFFRLKEQLAVEKPRLDFCFVAMHENLGQLTEVVRYARQVGAAEVFVHPVIGRHLVPYDFSRELSSNRLTDSFKDDLRATIASARATIPEVPLTVFNPGLDPDPRLTHTPAYFAPRLPAKGRIHTCDQSPLESVHILANGNVVVCEVHDEVPLGNLRSHTLREIWHSEPYREFRKKYVTAEIPECRECVWKMAYLPAPWKSALRSSEGMSPQLLRGWYSPDGESVIWSKRESLLALKNVARGKRLHIAGILPRAPQGEINRLQLSCNGSVLGAITNRSESFLPFATAFPLAVRDADILHLEMVTDHTFRPVAWGVNSDTRDLGFALEKIEVRC